MDTFYRAKLSLERVEPHTDGNGYPRALCEDIAVFTVTGATPADAMVQLCAHADSLHDWHVEQANDDEPMPLLDEAVKPASGWMDQVLRDLYESTAVRPMRGIFSPVTLPRHHCAVCGRPGPVLHEGNSYVCADCNTVLDAQKAEQAARTDETHDAYGTPIAPRVELDEGEPGQEGAEAENDPAFADTEADRDEEMRAALATDPAQVRIDEMARGETVAPPAGMPIVITTGPQPDPEAFRHLLREEMNRRGGRNRA